ncbi:3-oxoacyl-(Acyl-carrier-protein) reductase [Pleurostoma richardsiae]|uniref:3-oxoacyl-(Acyl-carrier-protein) reductase n=1 Tax=Pleurostoma richardsiae TaxID=41990 RepID=A0AA38VRW0_9PEZI|nr:3-oxoacyl-(Acyl-carrier-protein) reductase [Pleurostoma richardsiae]
MAFSPRLLAGKVGLVTGAGSPHGIGRSLVLSIATAGARAVYATDLTLANIPSLEQAVKESGSACKIHGAVLDVTSEEQTIDILEAIIADYGRLDFFFANAGVGTYRSLQDTDAAFYDRVNSIMQRSFFLALRYGGQAMSATSEEKKQPGGSIVVTSSMAGVTGGVSDLSYSTAKAAVGVMVKSGAMHLSSTHVRVNSIAPGLIRTSIAATSKFAVEGQSFGEELSKDKALNMFDAMLGDHGDTASKYYYNRIAGPEEIANIGVFLASDLSASINGQNIVADSGKTVAAFGENIIGPVPPMTPF